MNQKERTLITLKSLFSKKPKNLFGKKGGGDETINRDYVIEKIDACLFLPRPEILLDEEEKMIFEKLVERLRKEGKII